MYGVIDTHFSIEEYWEFLQINECAGYGIKNYPNSGILSYGCGEYWDQKFRYFLSTAIDKVERRLRTDRWLGFPIRWEYEKQRMIEYDWPLYLGKYVRAVGVETETAVDTVNLDLRTDGVINDPVTFTVTVDFDEESELIVKYPSNYMNFSCDAYKIRPKCVTISGTTATVEIPRCRLLLPEYFLDFGKNNDGARPDYEADANFLSQVDVYRNYADTTTGTNLVWRRHAGQVHCHYPDVWTCNPSGACSDVKQLACPYIRNQRDGLIQLEPATYSSGWSTASYAVQRRPDHVEIRSMRGYYKRYEEMDSEIIRAIVAMAHNNMARDYCGCSVQSLYYQEDTKPLEPAVRLKSGRSTWGLYEAEQILKEFDHDRNSHGGGML